MPMCDQRALAHARAPTPARTQSRVWSPACLTLSKDSRTSHLAAIVAACCSSSSSTVTPRISAAVRSIAGEASCRSMRPLRQLLTMSHGQWPVTTMHFMHGARPRQPTPNVCACSSASSWAGLEEVWKMGGSVDASVAQSG